MSQAWSRRPVRSAGAFMGPNVIVGVPVRTLSDDYQDLPVEPESDNAAEPASLRRRSKAIGALVSVVAVVTVPLLLLTWHAPAPAATGAAPLARICFGAAGTYIGGGACDGLPENPTFRSTDSLGLEMSGPFGGPLDGPVQLSVSKVDGATVRTVATWTVQPDPAATDLTTAFPASLRGQAPGSYVVRAAQDGTVFAEGSLTIVGE